MIRIDAIWIVADPMEIRAGAETALVRMVAVLVAAQPHCAYLFANRKRSANPPCLEEASASLTSNQVF